VVVANGTEGEPASFKDKTLLALAPHLVIDGAVAAARAIRATEVVVAVDLESRRALGVMDQAIAERQAAGVDAPIHVRVTATPSRYLTGQETALVQWLNGGDAKPTVVPPRPSDRGVGGRPTVVHNVETLAHIGLIARFGAAWYRGVGTAEDAGTLLVTVTGGVERPGVYEVPWGEPVGELVAAAGGVLAEASGLLVGGYYGTWLPVTAADTRLAVAPLAALGASAGAGVVAVLPPGVCPLVEAARVTRWLADQSAGQCGPCVNGLPALASALEAVAAGEPTGRAEAALMRWAAMVEGRGACHLPDGTARFVRSTLAVFGDHVIEHRRRGPCPAAPPVLATPPPGGWR